MMIINVEDVLEVQRKRTQWNIRMLKDIEFYKGGEKVEIDKEEIRAWEDTGLLVTDFVIGRIW